MSLASFRLGFRGPSGEVLAEEFRRPARPCSRSRATGRRSLQRSLFMLKSPARLWARYVRCGIFEWRAASCGRRRWAAIYRRRCASPMLAAAGKVLRGGCRKSGRDDDGSIASHSFRDQPSSPFFPGRPRDASLASSSWCVRIALVTNGRSRARSARRVVTPLPPSKGGFDHIQIEGGEHGLRANTKSAPIPMRWQRSRPSRRRRLGWSATTISHGMIVAPQRLGILCDWCDGYARPVLTPGCPDPARPDHPVSAATSCCRNRPWYVSYLHEAQALNRRDRPSIGPFCRALLARPSQGKVDFALGGTAHAFRFGRQ